MIGRTISHFEILKRLGSGGMGEVYLARDTRLGRQVALKLLPADAADDPGRLRRFVKEAEAASAINHPNVATIYEIDEADGVHFIAMEYVDGETLSARISVRPIETETIADIAAQIAAALDSAHRKEITHRDIKPANIMITQSGLVKVLDFGLAKMSPAVRLDGLSTVDQTLPGVVMGSVRYMSPEQALGRDVDHRSDLFSVGILLYEMATGRLPFSGKTAIEVIHNIINSQPEAISQLNPNIPSFLEEIVSRCLEKDKEHRFQSARELLEYLSRRSGSQPAASVRSSGSRGALPQQLTRFIGRARELLEIARQLRENRLLTLTGSGGVGKTRVALQIAERCLDEYADGVRFVDLAPLSDESLVAPTTASVLGLREIPGRPIIQTLVEYLHTKTFLIVLDNCEHLVGACAGLADGLLRASPGLHVLATSREPLGITGEAILRVPSLELPGPEQFASVETLRQCEAVQLFIDRARAVQPKFVLSEQNANALAQICIQLDGIPLAIELAASRVKVLSPEQIRGRLVHGSSLLRGGSRTALPRQQTLLATIDWSYNLLTTNEQTLFRRLSIFSGGWTLEAAETIASGGGIRPSDFLEVFSALVDKSMVLSEDRDGQERYRFMVTLHEYAAKRLSETNETEVIRRRHAEFFVALVESAEEQMKGPAQKMWAERLTAEYDNIRSVMNWSLRNEPEKGLRLAGVLGAFWYQHSSHFDETRRWLEELFEKDGLVEPSGPRAASLDSAGLVALAQGDYTSSSSFLDKALTFWRRLDDKRGMARTINHLGNLAYFQGRYERAGTFYEESLKIQRQLDNKHAIATALNNLALVAEQRGDYAGATPLYEESLAMRRVMGDANGVAQTLNNLGIINEHQGNYAIARVLFDESLEIGRTLGSKRLMGFALFNLASLAALQSDNDAAAAFLNECLTVRRDLGDRHGIARVLNEQATLARLKDDYASAESLSKQSLAISREVTGIATMLLAMESIAETALGCGRNERAACLMGAVEGLRTRMSVTRPPSICEQYQRAVERARSASGDKAFRAHWAQGELMTLDEAVSYALEDENSH